MFLKPYNKRPIIENCQIVSVSNFMRENLLSIQDRYKKQTGKYLTVKTAEDVESICRLIAESITINLRQENQGKIEFSSKNTIKLTYSRSNLGKGFIFWFVCNNCGRKVRYLYIPAYSEQLLCRICHRLAYKSQNERNLKRQLKKLGKWGI